MASGSYSSFPVLNPPPLPEGDGHDAPNWILLDFMGYIADHPNATLAKSFTRTGQPIEVVFCIARPPLVSHFCVHCPGLTPADFTLEPKVISAEADLILLRVSLHPSLRYCIENSDYFLYRAHPQKPSLDLVPHPYPNLFNDFEVALLRRADEYAIAALRSRPKLNEDGSLNEEDFVLYLYRSSKASDGWTSKELSVAEPLRDRVCPVEGALYHETDKVITLGGACGTVGWVDLWRGILLCDVLDENPVLRDLPLPLPMRGNWGRYHSGHRGSCPHYSRDITVSQCKDSIKYIEMEMRPLRNAVTADHPPDSYLDWFHRKPCSKKIRDGWKATTWSMPIPIASWEDWHLDCTFDVANLTVDDPMHSRLLPRLSGSDSDPTEATLLPRLIMCMPTMSMDDDVVYLMCKAHTMDKMEVVVAVDTRKKTLQGVAKLGTEKDFSFLRCCCTSEISKYLNKATGVNR